MDALILPLALGAMFYALIFLPQQKRKKQYAQLQDALGEGDEVVLNSGLYGFITALDDTIAYIEISDGVELKVDRDAIARSLEDPPDDDDDEEEEGD